MIVHGIVWTKKERTLNKRAFFDLKGSSTTSTGGGQCHLHSIMSALLIELWFLDSLAVTGACFQCFSASAAAHQQR